ncbi:MAG TPA: hypothetical protein VL442_19575 [Mucilaginibacter sp.]|nr:hypothetical protein [Mucilaginibacter sp.]
MGCAILLWFWGFYSKCQDTAFWLALVGVVTNKGGVANTGGNTINCTTCSQVTGIITYDFLHLHMSKPKSKIMTASNIFSTISVLLALVAVLISYISYKDSKQIAKDGFNRNFRPYVSANNFSSIVPGTNTFRPDMNVLSLNVINSPANIKSLKISFYIREIGHPDQLLFSHPIYHDLLIYPNLGQRTISTSLNTISNDLALQIRPRVLIRKVFIEYTWLSNSTDVYFFKLESEYEIASQNWQELHQEAN